MTPFVVTLVDREGNRSPFIVGTRFIAMSADYYQRSRVTGVLTRLHADVHGVIKVDGDSCNFVAETIDEIAALSGATTRLVAAFGR